jgi:uncharacterized membrane protein
MAEPKVVLTQNRFKSWALWLSTSALVLYVLKNVLKLDIDSEMWNTVVDMVLIVLTQFGILNAPTTKGAF